MESSQEAWTFVRSWRSLLDSVALHRVLEPWKEWSRSRLETRTPLAALKDALPPNPTSTLPIHIWIHLAWKRISRASGLWEDGALTSTWRMEVETQWQEFSEIKELRPEWVLVLELRVVLAKHSRKSWTWSSMVKLWVFHVVLIWVWGLEYCYLAGQQCCHWNCPALHFCCGSQLGSLCSRHLHSWWHSEQPGCFVLSIKYDNDTIWRCQSLYWRQQTIGVWQLCQGNNVRTTSVRDYTY